MLLALRNAVDITQAVRDARQTLVIIIGLALMLSVQLSLFLARTIVQRCARWCGRLCGCGWGEIAKWWCRACLIAGTRSACSPALFPT
jgi:two-component system sensor histidine kinase ChvG